MRLIDADELRKVISGLRVIITGVRYGKGLLCELVTEYCRNILKAIDESPTIDAVPVVRCKDCVYYEEAKVNELGFIICRASGMEITDNDFCSYGERRSDD